MGIPWARPNTPGFDNEVLQTSDGRGHYYRQCSFYQSARWMAVQSNWKEYSCTGMRLEYMPQGLHPATNQGNGWVDKMDYNAGLSEYDNNGLN